MRTSRGFTLIELMIVVAVAGILATVAGSYMAAARRNATVTAAASGIQMRVEQLQYVALSQQTPQLLVVSDVLGNDTNNCGTLFSGGCARVFHLRGPSASWKLVDFDVDRPATQVDAVEDEDRLGTRIKFHLGARGATLPKPFDAYGSTLKVFDDDLVGTCKGTTSGGNRKCVAFRFLPDGEVTIEFPDPTSATTAAKNGHAFALGSELTGEYRGAQQAGLLVAVPSGITRTFPVP